MNDTAKRHAIITGGSAGIGRAAAYALVRDGWTVTVCGRGEAALAETAADPRAAGAVDWAVCDITDEAAIASLFDFSLKRYGHIDLVVANAGMPGPTEEFGDVDVEQYRTTVDVNLTGTFLTCREAFRRMKIAGGGRIIVNASIAAQVPRPRSVAYASTKSALVGLTKVLSLDGRANGITCGRIDIGNAATELLAGFGVGEGALQANGSRLVEPTCDVDDAAKAIAFMASLPPEATVDELTVSASGMPFIGRG